MGILNFFSGKDPEDYDRKGDAFFEAGTFGKAIVEYEHAIQKLEKSSPWDDGYRQSLKDKINDCKERLAQEHENTARELMDAGHHEDARQYIDLALELTRDEQLKSTLEKQLEELEKSARAGIQVSLPNFDPTPSAPEEAGAPEDLKADEEYYSALIGTLPEKIQAAYRDYPPAFKIGYIALNQGNFEKAADYLSQAMQEIDDEGTYIRLELATANLNLGNFDEACQLAETFLKHHPDALPAYQLLCEVFWETKSFDRAEKLLDGLPDDLAESISGYLLKGETLYQAQKYSEAKSFYRDFLKQYEWHEGVARALAKTHEALDEMANARYIYRDIMEQCRGCHTRVDPFVKQKFADLSFNSGLNTSEILDIYLSLAQEVPQNAADYYHKVSQIYESQGNRIEAQRFQQIAEKYEKAAE
jgi:tetratricopeptide (TPR) repeat protein